MVGSPEYSGVGSSALTPSATSFPDLMFCPIMPPPWMSITCTWPESRSRIAGPPPL